MVTEMHHQFRGLELAEAHWDRHLRRQADRLRAALTELSADFYSVFDMRSLVERLFRECVVPADVLGSLGDGTAGATSLWDVLCLET